MKLIVDVFGSDHPDELIAGCAQCSLEVPEATLVLPGREELLRPALEALPHEPSRIEILPAETVITNHDDPIQAVMKHRDSSLVTGIQRLCRDPEVGAMLTAGSTGATFVAGITFLGRIKGVQTPTLATFLPSETGRDVCLADCGANVDCKPERLADFARLAVALMQSYGVENPRVGLLSVGVEEGKGSHFVRAAYDLLEQMPINFAGNMEARDALTGEYDVIVSEGFSGNVLLKSIEGTAMFVGSLMKRMFKKNVFSKLGYLLCSSGVKQMMKLLDYHEIGGTQLLGIKKPVIKAHGASDRLAFRNAVKQAMDAAENDITQDLEQALALLAQSKEQTND